jgi:hypothetical protein
LKEMRDLKRGKRLTQKLGTKLASDEGWEFIDKKQDYFDFKELEGREGFAVLNFPPKTTRVEIFMRLFPTSLVDSICQRLLETDPSRFSFGSGKSMVLTYGKIYMAIAARIRVQGIHNTPQRNTKNGKPQRAGFLLAMEHFKSTFPDLSCPGIDTVEKIHNSILITPNEEAQFSANLENSIVSIGQWVAGDEKLFKFTGKSHWVRLVPNKPDKIGLWSYMLTCKVT